MGIIKLGECLLKKNQEQYVFTETEPEDWPQEMILSRKLIEVFRALGRGWLLTRLQMNPLLKKRYRIIPGTTDCFALDFIDFDADKYYLFVYNGETGECRDIGPFSGHPTVVWRTKNGELAILLCRNVDRYCTEDGLDIRARNNTVFCFGSDGSERWRSEPEMHPYHDARFIHASENGVITFFASGCNAMLKADGLIWQIDGETGQLLRQYRLPFGYNVCDLMYIPDMNAFVYFREDTKRLVVLNEKLEEIQNYGGYEGSRYVNEENICGERIWYNLIMDGYIGFYDLRNGTGSTLQLEAKVYPIAVLPDGRIFGVNKKGNTLHVFDGEGKLLAKWKVPGKIRNVFSDREHIYALELRPESIRAFTGEFVGEITHHLWRIDPAL